MMKTEETMMMTTESQLPLNNYEDKSSSGRLQHTMLIPYLDQSQLFLHLFKRDFNTYP